MCGMGWNANDNDLIVLCILAKTIGAVGIVTVKDKKSIAIGDVS